MILSSHTEFSLTSHSVFSRKREFYVIPTDISSTDWLASPVDAESPRFIRRLRRTYGHMLVIANEEYSIPTLTLTRLIGTYQ